MKAVVFHGVGDIRLDDVPEPTIQEPTGAIARHPGWIKVDLLPEAS